MSVHPVYGAGIRTLNLYLVMTWVVLFLKTLCWHVFFRKKLHQKRSFFYSFFSSFLQFQTFLWFNFQTYNKVLLSNRVIQLTTYLRDKKCLKPTDVDDSSELEKSSFAEMAFDVGESFLQLSGVGVVGVVDVCPWNGKKAALKKRETAAEKRFLRRIKCTGG